MEIQKSVYSDTLLKIILSTFCSAHGASEGHVIMMDLSFSLCHRILDSVCLGDGWRTSFEVHELHKLEFESHYGCDNLLELLF